VDVRLQCMNLAENKAEKADELFCRLQAASPAGLLGQPCYGWLSWPPPQSLGRFSGLSILRRSTLAAG
jgi:hypothetical protein